MNQAASVSQPPHTATACALQQKLLHQRQRRGRRVNILGVWQPQVQFDYALMLGTLKAPTFVLFFWTEHLPRNNSMQLLDWQSAIANSHFTQSGQLTVIVLDNASVHRSRLMWQHSPQWQQQGLLLFFLLPYNPQMNRIDDQWLHLKRDELAPRIFDAEFDLALASIAGMAHLAQQGQSAVECFMFI